MADNLTYRFIHNEGDYFPPGYFNDDFFRKVQEAAGVTKEEELKAMRSPYVALRKDYEDYKNFILEAHTRREDAIKATHAFNTKLLNVLGYPTDHPYEEPYVTGESKKDDSVCEIIPVRHILRNGNNVSMVVMEMQHLVTINDEPQPGLFEQRYQDEEKPGQKPQRYWAGQWRGVIPEKFLDKTRYRFSPAIINKAVTQIFLMEESRRPRYILLLAGNCVFLFDQDKWSRGAYLQFSLDDLFVQGRVNATRFYYALFHLLARKETLAGDGQTVLMASLIEQSYKSAYEVTKDLKEGVVTAVETIANEALHYMKNVAKTNFGKLKKREDGTEYYDETDDEFENEVKDDCITIVYRLLFILFAESRPELGILPTSDQTYKLGYSFEALRDLEQVNLVSEAGRNGYFFDAGIKALFKVLAKGYTPNVGAKATNKSFRVGRIDSPMFDPMRLKHLQGIKLRNVEWQKIIRALSLSHGKNFVGRISYANLGVNQIGSVYESLLAYRGFYAEEDYIEVHKADKPGEGTFLVPYARIDAFADNEILHDKDGNVAKLPKGRFVYRLNGRDRQKSASYYTPEVLTKSTVKYTLKAIIDEVKSGERKATDLLDLKILEPAMGAAAFQNEVINQVAEAYFECRQHELRKKGDKDWRVDPDKYRDELQKTKAYIATRNVYGVDLNPTAVELGKLSLWLNVIHKNMQTPFFANHLALGNAVVGAWLKAYSREDVVGIKSRNGKKLEKNAWWEKAPHKVKFQKKRVARSVNDVYHFLLPDENMLAVRSIREQKLNHPEEARRMTELIKDWTKPVTEKDFRRLQYLSGMIDVLLREHYEYQMSMEEYTFSRKNLWGMPGREQGNQLDLDGSDWYATKERLFKARFAHDSAYFRVKMVMDFWCSLWFWDFAEAAKLPTRDEFWDEIEKMLNVDESKLEKGAQEAFREYKTGMATLTQLDLGLLTQPPEEPADDATPDFKLLAKEAILAAGSTQGYFSNSPRFQLVKSYSDRYRFFHPMLDFLEVFWSRGGFDVICGNPPWIVTQFDEVSVISEKFPEVAIKKVSAPDVRNMRGQFLANASQNQIFFDEQTDCYCSSVFMNAMCSYPLLIGQKANLYKCVLTNCFDLVNANGYTGLLTPESIYDDPKGDALREELYMRLRYHFQYQNELRLFAEVHHHTLYGDQLLGPRRSSSPCFASLSNLFHPVTVDACFAHDGHGECEGKKTKDGKWNVNGHKNRIVWVDEEALRVLAKSFEGDENLWKTTKLVSIHNDEIIKSLGAFSRFESHVSDFQTIITPCWNETISVDEGILKRETRCPDVENYEMVYNGPQFGLANPICKTPRSVCKLNCDYDTVDLTKIEEDFVLRSNYKPLLPVSDYSTRIKGFQIGQDPTGKPVYANWMDYFKLAFREMVGADSERTLTCAVLRSKTAHVNAVISVAFGDGNNCVDMAGLCSSLPMDFYAKVLGVQHISPSRIQNFPMGVADKFLIPLRARTLRLNCLTRGYDALWRECWNEAYCDEAWSLEDSRLSPWGALKGEWEHATPLRNYFERRMALVEIDVLAAMALGLTLKELEMMYTIQFPVLQQNENDTWYDASGNIVFTCSKGLTGVGLSRPQWESMRGELVPDSPAFKSYSGTPNTQSPTPNTQPTYTHVIDPAKSELYGNREVVYTAPYTCCDRIADYRRAWAFFAARLGVIG